MLVNAVNCVGVMGKGVALEFKTRFPRYFDAYRAACTAGHVRTGKVWSYVPAGSTVGILSVATKDDWRRPSRIEWVKEGVTHLAEAIQKLQPRVVAMPALGCGQGGLDWSIVRPLIIDALDGAGPSKILLYQPSVSPARVLQQAFRTRY